ncbi:hypothetical protein PEDI_54030 [Persicobacter diffluens]|uniref:Uncharacterized protein n=1 Tax=Persicobacter diffluens TaxID=981 RepID=A0AAN4W397_9BACT|nr:hypothetical protein PEDI_54030 [Persicobacter diffluens]
MIKLDFMTVTTQTKKLPFPVKDQATYIVVF